MDALCVAVRGFIFGILGTVCLLCFAEGLQAQPVSTYACFGGDQTIPASNSPAIVTGEFTVDPVLNSISYKISHSGLLGTPTSAHLHSGTCGSAGSILASMAPSGNPLQGTITGLAPSQISLALSGGIYADIHTTVFPVGEVRAQLFNSGCAGSCSDCNHNSIPDVCDISCGAPGGVCSIAGCGLSEDLNGNGKLDECETVYDFFGIDDFNQLFRIHRDTFEKKIIGTLNVTMTSLAYDTIDNKMYGIASNGTIYEVNPGIATTEVVQVQPFSGFANPAFSSIGFAMQGTLKYLYFANGNELTGNTEFFRLDLNVAAPYPVVKLGAISSGSTPVQTDGFAYDADTDTFYASSNSVDSLMIVDKANGQIQATLTGSPFNSIRDIEFDPNFGDLYGIFGDKLIKLALGGGTDTQVAIINSASTLVVAPRHPGPLQIGEDIPFTVETSHPYDYYKDPYVIFGNITPGAPFITHRKHPTIKSFTIHAAGATYIAPHFAKLNIALTDHLILRSPDKTTSWKYTGSGPGGLGAQTAGVWGIAIPGDTAVIDLVQYTENLSAYGFKIDKFARGLTDSEIQQIPSNKTQAICDLDDSKEAKCYETSEASAYDRAKPVARILIDGKWHCTGFLFGSEGHLLTNDHCFDFHSQIKNTTFEFNAEGATCSTNCQTTDGCKGTYEAVGGELIDWSPPSKYDYALIKLDTSVNLPQKYGYLQARPKKTTVGERIYLPGHPLGFGKRISLASSDPHDSGYCSVNDIAGPYSGVSTLVTYADIRKGSSGSPMLSYNDDSVVGLLNSSFSNSAQQELCPNFGTPITEIMDNMYLNLPKCARSTDLNCPPASLIAPTVSECTSCTTSVTCTFPATCVNGKCIDTTLKRSVGEDCCDGSQCTSSLCDTAQGYCFCSGDFDCDSTTQKCSIVPTSTGDRSLCVKKTKNDNCQGLCLFDSDCVSGHCVGGKCVNNDNSYELDAVCCKNVQCKSDSCQQGFCSCKVSSDCDSGYFCNTGIFPLGGNTCDPVKASCDFCEADKQCGSGLYCDGKPFGRCITGVENLALGKSCCRDDQCASGSCPADNSSCQCTQNSDCATNQYCAKGFLGLGKNTCKDFIADCTFCTQSSHCGPGALCKLGKCATKDSVASGGTCCRDYQCQGSLKCKQGKCKS